MFDSSPDGSWRRARLARRAQIVLAHTFPLGAGAGARVGVEHATSYGRNATSTDDVYPVAERADVAA